VKIDKFAEEHIASIFRAEKSTYWEIALFVVFFTFVS
jgi:hypothetical protein